MGMVISKGSQIGRVSWRHERPWWDSSWNFVCGVYFIIFNCCATPNSDLLFNMMKGASLQKRIPVELEVKVCEKMKPGTHRHSVLWCCSSRSWFHTSQDLTFSLYTREVCMGVSWCWGWRSVVCSLEVWGLSPGRHWGGSSQWQCGQKCWIYFHKNYFRIAWILILWGGIFRGMGVGGEGGCPPPGPPGFRFFLWDQFPCLEYIFFSFSLTFVHCCQNITRKLFRQSQC